MATDVKNNAGGDTGSAQNGRITVAGNRNNYQYQDLQEPDQDYTISKFDNGYIDTEDPTDGAALLDRFDDPTYYG